MAPGTVDRWNVTASDAVPPSLGEVCGCDDCVQLTDMKDKISKMISHHLRRTQEAQLLASNAVSITETLSALHRRHRPELYDTESCAVGADAGSGSGVPENSVSNLRVLQALGAEGPICTVFELDTKVGGKDFEVAARSFKPAARHSRSGLQPTDQVSDVATQLRSRLPGEVEEDHSARDEWAVTPASKTYADYEQFIVCDHCRAHGLPCNEAAICDQCSLHEVVCIHHACKLSPNSKKACPRRDCRYVHQDHMPTSKIDEMGAEWIVLPGNLSTYLSKEKRYDNGGKLTKSMPAAVLRQKTVFAKMEAFVQEGKATWETIAVRCDCMEKEMKRQAPIDEFVAYQKGLR